MRTTIAPLIVAGLLALSGCSLLGGSTSGTAGGGELPASLPTNAQDLQAAYETLLATGTPGEVYNVYVSPERLDITVGTTGQEAAQDLGVFWGSKPITIDSTLISANQQTFAPTTDLQIGEEYFEAVAAVSNCDQVGVSWTFDPLNRKVVEANCAGETQARWVKADDHVYTPIDLDTPQGFAQAAALVDAAGIGEFAGLLLSDGGVGDKRLLSFAGLGPSATLADGSTCFLVALVDSQLGKVAISCQIPNEPPENADHPLPSNLDWTTVGAAVVAAKADADALGGSPLNTMRIGWFPSFTDDTGRYYSVDEYLVSTPVQMYLVTYNLDGTPYVLD